MMWASTVAISLATVVIVSWLAWLKAKPKICGEVWGASSRYPGSNVVCNYIVDDDGEHLCGDPMHKDSTEAIWWES